MVKESIDVPSGDGTRTESIRARGCHSPGAIDTPRWRGQVGSVSSATRPGQGAGAGRRLVTGLRQAGGPIVWMLLLSLLTGLPTVRAAEMAPRSPSGAEPVNPGLECGEGTAGIEAAQGGIMQVPNGWSVHFLSGTPWLASTRMQYNGGNCGGSSHVERIEGDDSLAIFAHDLEWTESPGKPFDVVIYQQVAATPGSAYSLSAWMVSLCGGSTVPNDCPPAYYMAKMLGIDPTGGTDPLASTVIWTEDRSNFVEDGRRVGWANLRLAAGATADTITLFARINSPFQWHGNHAFVDAFSLMPAPQAELEPLPAQVDDHAVEVRWHGQLGAPIEAIPGGTHQLRFDLQLRVGVDGEWQDWLVDREAGSAQLVARQEHLPHFVRVRARAEQPPGGSGAWPNHRYPGTWSEPATITFRQSIPSNHHLYLPQVQP